MRFKVGDAIDAEQIATKFFHLTGTLVRSVSHGDSAIPGIGIPTIGEQVDFHSTDAEQKLKAQELRLLPPRMFVVNYNGLSQPQVDISVKVEEQGIDEEKIQEYVKKIKEICNKRDGKLKKEMNKHIEEEAQKNF